MAKRDFNGYVLPHIQRPRTLNAYFGQAISSSSLKLIEQTNQKEEIEQSIKKEPTPLEPPKKRQQVMPTTAMPVRATRKPIRKLEDYSAEEKQIRPGNETPKDAIIAYTDGSCFGNGTATQSAGYGVFFGDDHPWLVTIFPYFFYVFSYF